MSMATAHQRTRLQFGHGSIGIGLARDFALLLLFVSLGETKVILGLARVIRMNAKP